MNQPSVSFEKIEIVRAPGFEKGGFTVDDLSPGVNVIYGPNASGKTTLTRAMRRLLQPSYREASHETLNSMVEVDGQRFRLAYDTGRATCQREGAEAEYPALVPPDMVDRYVLALHDLLVERNKDGSQNGDNMAKEVVLQSAGGYDVREASKSLGFLDRPSGKGRLLKEHKRAQEDLRDAKRPQNELLGQERQLASLQERWKKARAAAQQLTWLDRAEACLNAKETLLAAERRVKDFPEEMTDVRGDDFERLGDLRQRADAARDRLDDARTRLGKAKAVLDKSPLPTEGVAAEVVSALKQKAQQLHNMATQVASARQHASQTSEELDHARALIGPDVENEQAQLLDQATLQQIISFARGVDKLRAENAAKEELHRWLSKDEPAEDGDARAKEDDVDALGRGAELLQRWLAIRQIPSAAQPTVPLVPVAVAGVLALMSLVMGFAYHLSWLLALVPAAALAAWLIWPRRREAVPDRVGATRDEFNSLHIEPPDDWSNENVRTHVRLLQRRFSEASLAREKAIRWGDLQDEVAELNQRMRDADKMCRQWSEQVGVDPVDDEVSLVHVAETIHDYQQADGRSKGSAAALAEAQRQQDELLQDVSDDFTACGLEVVADPQTATARAELLDQYSRDHRDARTIVSSPLLSELEKDVSQCDRKIEDLYGRVGVNVGDEATLRRSVDMHADYQAAVQQARDAKRDNESARDSLSDHQEMLDLSRDEIIAQTDRCRGLATQVDKLREEITRIDDRIDRAKRSHSVGVALSQLAAADDALRDQRAADQDDLVGSVLVDFLSRDQRDHERVGVFSRARELFAAITHYRYRLDIDAGQPPKFRAFDTADEVGLALDQLSSGTRLQLLIAVRVAFVERQEHGRKLPLIFDEALGNSDERRAREIIDAAIEICRGGRQIFYFTAQHDEVAKWRRAMEEAGDVPFKVVDLAKVREFSESDQVPAVDFVPPPPVEVPSPEGLDWFEYGRRLKDLSPLDPYGARGNLHLWYAIDNLPTLYELLTHEINKWGQLENLASYGSTQLISRDSHDYRRAEASVRAIDVVARFWRIGRGIPVDRNALVNSGAVTEKFIDAVVELAQMHDGDATALLSALDDGHVKGFREAKRIELREYLQQHGYLDDRDVLCHDEILDQVRAVVFSDLESGLLTAERLAHFVAMITGAVQHDTPESIVSP